MIIILGHLLHKGNIYVSFLGIVAGTTRLEIPPKVYPSAILRRTVRVLERLIPASLQLRPHRPFSKLFILIPV
jgi:hypothetical protein